MGTSQKSTGDTLARIDTLAQRVTLAQSDTLARSDILAHNLFCILFYLLKSH